MSTTTRTAPAAETDRIRSALAEALSLDCMSAVDAARFRLRVATSGRDAARNSLDAMSHGDHAAELLADASAACDAAGREMVDARTCLDEALAAASAGIRPIIADPIEEQRDIVLALLDQTEAAMDPLTELQAVMAHRGLPPPSVVSAAGAALSHLREIRRLIGRDATAQRLLNAAERFAA